MVKASKCQHTNVITLQSAYMARMDTLKEKMETEHKAQIDRIKQDHQTEKDTIERLHKDKCEHYIHELDKKERRINNLEDNLEDKKKEITQLNNKLTTKTTENTNLQASLNTKNTEYQTLKRNYDIQNTNYETLKGTFATKKQEAINLETRIRNKDQEISNLQNNINTKNSQINNLENNIESKNKEIRNLESLINSERKEKLSLKSKLDSYLVLDNPSNRTINVKDYWNLSDSFKTYAIETTKTAFNCKESFFDKALYIMDKLHQKYKNAIWLVVIMKNYIELSFPSDAFGYIIFSIGIYDILIYGTKRN